MKNVTGLDLVKLMAGSHGTLGFLTEVTFRVPPRPKTEATIVISGLNDAEAANAMAAAMALPLEVSGAAHLPMTVAVEISRRHPAPRARRPCCGSKACPAPSDAQGDKARCRDGRRSGRSRAWIATRAPSSGGRSAMSLPYADGTPRPVWRVSVAPSIGHQLVAALRLEAGVDAFYDWQGGLVWMRMEADAEADLVRRFIKALGGGHATLIRAATQVTGGDRPPSSRSQRQWRCCRAA